MNLQSVVLFLSTFLLAQITVVVNSNGNELRRHIRLSRETERGFITSDGYPMSCCQPMTYILAIVNPSEDTLHLVFDDLDLPPDFTIKIYNGSGESQRDLLFDYESSLYANNVLICPRVISSTNNSLSIALQVNANSQNRQHASTSSGKYVGFKARYWINNNSLAGISGIIDNASSGTEHRASTFCQLISIVSAGQPVALDTSADETIQDYIWIIKQPLWSTTAQRQQHYTSTFVYMRFNELRLHAGYIEIRNASHSSSNLLSARYSSSSNWLGTTLGSSSSNSIRQPMLSSDWSPPLPLFGASSTQGLYIRLILDESQLMYDTHPDQQQMSSRHDVMTRLSFVTGVYRPGLDSTDDGGGWFMCVNSSHSVPTQYQCDGVLHCCHAEDEAPEICSGLRKQDRDNSLSFLKWLIPVIAGFVICGIVLFSAKLCIRHKEAALHRHTAVSQTSATVDNGAREYLVDHTEAPPSCPFPTFSPPDSSSSSSSAVISVPGRHVTRGTREERSELIGQPLGRSAPIPIPFRGVVPYTLSRVVDDENIPPSYEEVTAAENMERESVRTSIESEDDGLPEFECHPPSYEDASQGKTDLVSSWVSTSLTRSLQTN